ncbi:MAG: hypothetical protein GX547_06635 [Phycisphaerae bacterium]|nr:hypothetical protein [Phycisphaerae bacterium]
MATMFQTLASPLEIPAVEGKIIKLDRLTQSMRGTVMGTKVLRIQSNSNDILPNMCCKELNDLRWPEHQPQGERGQSVVIDISGNEPLISVWVAYRYVD